MQKQSFFDYRQNAATVSGTATLTDIIGSDVVTLNTAGTTFAFNDKNAGTSKPVTVTGLSLVGTDVGNCALQPLTSLASVAPTPPRPAPAPPYEHAVHIAGQSV